MVWLAPEPRPSPFTRYVYYAHAQIAEFAHTQLHSARARVITDGRKNGEPEARHDVTGNMPLPKVGENIRISYCKLTFHKFRSVACVLYVQFSLHKTLQSMPDHFENASSGPACSPRAIDHAPRALGGANTTCTHT